MISVSPVDYIITFIAGLSLSWMLTGLFRRAALRVNITDKPDGGRKNQKEPVPYLGGVAIMLSLLIVILLGAQFKTVPKGLEADILYLLVPSFALGLVGLWDDIKQLSPQFRLMIQVLIALAGSLSISFGGFVGSATGNETTDLLLSIFWIVGITNSINFFDNTDGGAAVACFTTSAALFFYSIFTQQPYIALFGVILMGVLLGFFIWNRRPARIYMGDSGALFLGMLLATIVIRIDPATDSKTSALSVPVFFLMLPILDTTVVVFNRLRNGISPLQGGQDHLSHRLHQKGVRHRHILYRFGMLSFLFQVIPFLMLVVGKQSEVLLALLGLVIFVTLFLTFSKLPAKYVS